MALISPANAATTASSGTSHGTGDAHGKGGFPPFQSETFASQLVSFAIAFILLYVIVSRFALPQVGGIIDKRQSVIDNDLAEAQRLKSESDAAIKAYETELATARANAQTIGSEIREKLTKQADGERKQLEDRLAAKLVDAEKTIAVTRNAAMGNVRSIATDAAAAIVQRLVGTTPDTKAVEAAVDASLKG
jgi:F-type H+-transporting ATPase subunit b